MTVTFHTSDQRLLLCGGFLAVLALLVQVADVVPWLFALVLPHLACPEVSLQLIGLVIDFPLVCFIGLLDILQDHVLCVVHIRCLRVAVILCVGNLTLLEELSFLVFEGGR